MNKLGNIFDKNYYDFYSISLDEKVNDCLLNLYFYLMSNENEKSDKYYNDFEKEYYELTEEQKEVVKKEIKKY